MQLVLWAEESHILYESEASEKLMHQEVIPHLSWSVLHNSMFVYKMNWQENCECMILKISITNLQYVSQINLYVIYRTL